MAIEISVNSQAARSVEPVMPAESMTFAQRAGVWILLVVICLGLGYPTLNRYDPGKLEGTSDVVEYRNMLVGRTPPVSGGSGALERLAQAENYYRVLVPYVAKPFYWLARNRVGTWDAALLGLLIANAMFTATTVCLLIAVGCRLGLAYPTALLGGTLYLLDFCVANFNLAGLVDSAEGCFLMVVVWSLMNGRWYLLPIWGVLGALAKETFVPLCTMFVFGWWVAEIRRRRLQPTHLAWMGGMSVAGLAAVTLMMSHVAHGAVWPWQLAEYLDVKSGLLTGFLGSIFDHTFWFAFAWLLPLGAMRLGRLPRPWVVASITAFCGALALGAYNNAGGNTTRALFNVSGPVLSLSAAMYLASAKSTWGAGRDQA